MGIRYCICAKQAETRKQTEQLSCAVRQADFDRMHTLCVEGADVNGRRTKGWTPLMYAAGMMYAGVVIQKRLAMVKLLCDHGADVNKTDTDGMTPLCCATMRTHNLDVVRFLCEHGAHVNHTNRYRKWTALMEAANVGDLEVVQYLCEHGADINHQSVFLHVDKYTPLMSAVLARATDVVRYLCEHGADVNYQGVFNADKSTPLSLAIRPFPTAGPWEQSVSIPWESIKILCAHGADVNYSSHSYRNDSLLTEFLEGSAMLQYYGGDEQEQFCDGLVALLSAGSHVSERDHELIEALHPVLAATGMLEYVSELCVSPSSLKRLCKFAVRSSVYKPLAQNLPKTNLPESLQQYLLLATII